MTGTYRVFANGLSVGNHVQRAASFTERLRGLLSHTRLKDGEGLWLTPGASIHTIGMRFPIDVVFLDRGHFVLDIRRNVKPNRACRAPRRTRSTLELRAGACSDLGVERGQKLRFEVHENE